MANKSILNAFKEMWIQVVNYVNSTSQEWAKVTDTALAASVTVADKTEYRFPNATNVSITCPTNLSNYECWIYIGGANASFSIANGMQIGNISAEDYSSTSGIEISIKDGKYTVGFSGVSA